VYNLRFLLFSEIIGVVKNIRSTMCDKMQSFVVLEKLPIGFEVLTSHAVASAALVDGRVTGEG
jgi:hypothetical protein